MKDIAIFGASGLGRETVASLDKLTYYNREGWNFIGFFDDTHPVGSLVKGFGPILGGIDELNNWTNPLNIALCLGYPKARMTVAQKITNPLISFPNLVHINFYCTHPQTFKIGQGNIIQGGCFASTDISIGNFNLMNGMVGIGHDARIGSFNSFMPRALVSGNVHIGDRNLFGANSFVVEKINIKNDITLSPLSVLLTHPNSGKTYIGNPAKIFKY